ncbi:MAG: secondary thiamine-phosphate synthase enzyme YjbQ [Chloroflexota bacterium]|nr:secondary thiamine-phosphate synthase enzyme YjbQ [Chloroflexota bacterium]MDE2885048.1 secondary thiamine-phosphate synthase enzyme YjbQ [Chloroflexota bacterium]
MTSTTVTRLRIETDGAPEFYDITENVRWALADSRVRDGLLCVYCAHTTAAIVINEHEPLLIDDMKRFLRNIAPEDAYYAHNDFAVRTVNMTPDEVANGHSHCAHLLLPSSETIPVIDGELALGTWQSVFMVELDHPRTREVIISVYGS